MKRGSALLVLGVVVGLVGSLVLPRVLPVSWRLAFGSVEGTVEAEQREDGRLLLTLSSPQGVILATFEEDVAEIDFLVGLGDRITLAARGYRPFLQDPVIARVERAPAPPPPVEAAVAPSPEEATSEDVEEEAGEEALPAQGEAEQGEAQPEAPVIDEEGS